DARLQVPPKSPFFGSAKSSGLLTDPSLVDSCGQSIGFWASDRLETGFATFPLGFHSLEICGPWPQESELLKCHVRITSLTDARVRSNLEFVDLQGRLLVRVTGWQDSRFDFPRPFSRFVLSPCERILSENWPQAIQHLSAGRFQCCFLEKLPSAVFHGNLWPRAFARIILTPSEREVWANLKGVMKRRMEWMMGRVAAKDAVRILLKDKADLDLSPAEIEISTDKYGRPIISPGFVEKVNCQLIVSITHSRGRAMAIAGEKDSDHGIGIDMEYLDRDLDGIKKGALSPQELILLSSVCASLQDEWILRMWCAKEAVAKALGRGMAGSPFNLVIKALDSEKGTIAMTIAGELAKQFPLLDQKLLTSHTHRDNDLVVATSLV
ncbi:MAG: 4'-phosphopantetheinyl transferase superfamily protein, partial [bacterium]